LCGYLWSNTSPGYCQCLCVPVVHPVCARPLGSMYGVLWLLCVNCRSQLATAVNAHISHITHMTHCVTCCLPAPQTHPTHPHATHTLLHCAQVFDKALFEPHFCELYSQLCFVLQKRLPEFEDPGGCWVKGGGFGGLLRVPQGAVKPGLAVERTQLPCLSDTRTMCMLCMMKEARRTYGHRKCKVAYVTWGCASGTPNT
jgi:hypothetical protein